MLHVFHISSQKWICTSDYTVTANLGFYLVVYSSHKITSDHYDGKC